MIDRTRPRSETGSALRGRCHAFVGVACSAALVMGLALAQRAARADDGVAAATQPAGFWDRQTLGGDLGGAGPWLDRQGITIGLADIEEVLGNPTGGVHQGSAYDGATALQIDGDLDTMLGWQGAKIVLSGAEVRGHGLSEHALGNILTVSNIEATPEARLFDLYLEQSFLDGALSVRAGQMEPLDEFMISRYADSFINTTFGWPGIAGADLPGDSPVSELATPGIRLKLTRGEFSWQGAVIEGAANMLNGPPEVLASSGTGNGVLLITEASLKLGGAESSTLPATFKLGGWYDTERFGDLRLDQAGDPLAADPNATPLQHQGDYGVYAIADRMLWRKPGTTDQGIGAFVRVSGAPGDRNLISFYADAGLIQQGLIPGRPSDIAGIAFAWAEIGSAAGARDRDAQASGMIGYPVRDHEAVAELTYRLAVAPWWTLQPDCQYVIHPGGNIPNPELKTGTTPIPDALVIGLRSTVSF